MMGSLRASATKIAKALRRASDEHGRPNSFGCQELTEYGAPGAMAQGRVGARLELVAWIFKALGGRVGWGTAPVYSPATRRWYV
jgi:hypothetical protein